MENGDIELGYMVKESVKSLLYSLKQEENHASQSSPSIFMAPRVLRDLSPSSFDPLVVSIGPLHKRHENVQTFEKKKASYLTNLVKRTKSSQEEILKSCMQEAYSSMNEIKAFYVWTENYNDAKIAKMMVMDACFILEFMLDSKDSANQSYQGRLLQHYSVLHDMVLLENQIPLFFLDKIFQRTILKFMRNTSLVELIVPVLKAHNLFGVDMEADNISIDRTTHHILALLHKCYTPQNYNTTNTEPASRIPTHSAVNLYRAGINIRPNQKPTWLMELDVEKNWFPCFFRWSMLSLKMPVLKVHDSTEFLLRNLIAYEQSFQSDKHHSYVTSFALAMDMLMNTQEDVAKLIDSGVLINHMGSNEEAANMINNICKHVIWEEFIYKEQWIEMDDYCNSYWPKHIAKMWTTYFSSPWSMIALIAGIMLFTLAVIDTIFTVNPPE